MSAVLDNVGQPVAANKAKRRDTSVLEPRWVRITLIAVALVTALGAAGVSWILRRYTPGTESQAYPDNH